jgi:hypothetical protein
MSGTAFLFVLDDILMDSVYHHVLAWQETLHRARSLMVMSAYFKSPSESFQTAPPELTHPGLIEIADQHMPPGEETSSRSLGQNSLSFPSRKRTSTTTYSFPRSSPQPRCTELFTCPLPCTSDRCGAKVRTGSLGSRRYLRGAEHLHSHLARLAGRSCPDIRWHDLRDTCATLLLKRGVHSKLVQHLLGHASITMTLDRYSHWILSMGRHAADGMDEVLG